MAYRSTIHESTGCSPNLLMLNREIAMPIAIVAGNPLVHTDTECQIQYIEWLSHIMQKTHEFAFQNLERSAQTQSGIMIRDLNHAQFCMAMVPASGKVKTWARLDRSIQSTE